MKADSTVHPTPHTHTSKNICVWHRDENFPEVQSKGQEKETCSQRGSLHPYRNIDILELVTSTCPEAAVPFSLAPRSGWAVVVFLPRQTALDCTIPQVQLSPRSTPTEQHMLFLNYGLIWQMMNLEQRWGRTLAELYFIQQGRHCHTARWKRAEQALKAAIFSRWG